MKATHCKLGDRYCQKIGCDCHKVPKNVAVGPETKAPWPIPIQLSIWDDSDRELEDDGPYAVVIIDPVTTYPRYRLERGCTFEGAHDLLSEIKRFFDAQGIKTEVVAQ